MSVETLTQTNTEAKKHLRLSDAVFTAILDARKLAGVEQGAVTPEPVKEELRQQAHTFGPVHARLLEKELELMF